MHRESQPPEYDVKRGLGRGFWYVEGAKYTFVVDFSSWGVALTLRHYWCVHVLCFKLERV